MIQAHVGELNHLTLFDAWDGATCKQSKCPIN